VISSPLLLGDEGGYQISRSVRIRQSASAYLNRTPASATNRKTWTWSGWVKIGKAASTGLFTASTSGSNMYTIQLGVGGDLNVYAYTGTYPYFRQTSAVFRDYSAWYHFVVAFDSTQATDTNRIKIYVNGVLQSTVSGSGSGWPTLNYDGGVNNTINHQFSDNVGGASYFDGYLTEVNFIDGQALTPSSFGETNAITGVWQPKKYAGTYGTNGFYLNFSDNSAVTTSSNVGIGKDFSGNGNYWTSNNISVTAGATYDSMLDVPTLYADGGNGRGNYCTLNPLATNTVGVATLTNGNLTFSVPNTFTAIGSMSATSGKFYWEAIATSNPVGVGLKQVNVLDRYSNTIYYMGSSLSASGEKYVNGTGSAYGASWTTGDVIGVAVDMDGGTVTFYKNNASQGSIALSTASITAFVPSFVSGAGVTFAGSVNFGQRPFTYTPPSGFVALNTQNLPDATIKNGATSFASTLYTGNDTGQSITNTVNGISFQPDLLWIKARSTTYGHVLADAVRGVSAYLASESTAVEGTNSELTSFNSNGFTLGATGSKARNVSGATYVAWQWDAGTTTVTNTSGTISAQVRANPTAGFSIVTYTGTGANATVGHGLGVAPKMIIVFERTPGGDDHIVYHASLTSNLYSIRLNTTVTQAGPSGAYWNSTSPTSTVFSVGTSGESNQSTATYVAYCFAAVAGYSAFGSYTGNNLADGPFVYLGFRPRFIMFKDASANGVWMIMDTARNTYNVLDDGLAPNNANAESSYSNTAQVDFLSNGFKIRATNANQYWNNISGNTIIYAAFAESPFRNSLAF
jgi:hypothetical protein